MLSLVNKFFEVLAVNLFYFIKGIVFFYVIFVDFFCCMRYCWVTCRKVTLKEICLIKFLVLKECFTTIIA